MKILLVISLLLGVIGVMYSFYTTFIVKNKKQ